MAQAHPYRPTTARYKGGAREMYITYEIKQETRSGKAAAFPKVKRVYISGDVKKWTLGQVQKRSGRPVHGLAIAYTQERRRAHRGNKKVEVKASSMSAATQTFTRVVEIPENASRVHFYQDGSKLPQRYKSTLQNVR